MLLPLQLAWQRLVPAAFRDVHLQKVLEDHLHGQWYMDKHRGLEHVWIACIMPLHIQRTELLLVVASEGDAMARGEVQGHAKANASIFSTLNKPSISPHDLAMQKAT